MIYYAIMVFYGFLTFLEEMYIFSFLLPATRQTRSLFQLVPNAVVVSRSLPYHSFGKSLLTLRMVSSLIRSINSHGFLLDILVS